MSTKQDTNWTTEKPTIPGWYWCRKDKGEIRIGLLRREESGYFTSVAVPGGIAVHCNDKEKWEFQGPLQLPD